MNINSNDKNLGGRPANDFYEIIDYLKNKYSSNPIFSSVTELQENEPNYAGKIKTLANQSNELFGMTLKDYLYQQNVLRKKEKPIKVPKELKVTKTSKNAQFAVEIVKQKCLDAKLDIDKEMQKLNNLILEYREESDVVAVTGIKEYSKIIEIPFGVDKMSSSFYKQLDGVEKIVIGGTIKNIDLKNFSDCKSLLNIVIENSKAKIKGIQNCSFNYCIDRTLAIKEFLETKNDTSKYEEAINFLEKCFSIIKTRKVVFWLDEHLNLAFTISGELYKTKINLIDKNDLIIKIDEVLENIYNCNWIMGTTEFIDNYLIESIIELDNNFNIERVEK